MLNDEIEKNNQLKKISNKKITKKIKIKYDGKKELRRMKS
jgi:hypothetical protein